MEECYEVEVLCKGKRLSGISVGSVAVGDGALLVTGGACGCFRLCLVGTVSAWQRTSTTDSCPDFAVISAYPHEPKA